MSIIKIDLTKFKIIAHDKRREARAKEFEPHDEVIAKQIPNANANAAEAARQAVRDKYAVMQDQIDAAKTVEELIAVMPKL
jgi:uncharacterized protein YktB (UPF0637 family)